MNKQLTQQYRAIAHVETFIVFLLCSFVIVGWVIRLNMLTKGVIYSAPMHPLAGFVCMLGVVAHYLQVREVRGARYVPQVLASVILLLGVARIIEYYANVDFRFLYSPFVDNPVFHGSSGKFAPITAICFISIALALLTYRTRIGKGFYPTAWLCLLAATISYARIIGYLYGGEAMSTIGRPLQMSFITALSLFLLSTAILLSQGGPGMLRLLTRELPGSRIARYLVPIALMLPVATGLLHTYSKEFRLLSDSVNIPLIILLNVAVMIGLVWKNSIYINKSWLALEQERSHSERLKEQLRIEEAKHMQNYLMEIKLKQQKELMLATISGQEKEKRKLGLELHDHVNQVLASSKLYLEMASGNAEPDVTRQLVEKARGQLNDAIQEIRRLSHSLIVHEKGTESVLQNITTLLNNVKEATGMQLHVDISRAALNDKCPDLQLSLFRILQEQLQNVIKHSRAENVSVTLEDRPGLLYFAVADDGIGFDVDKATGGIGIKNIRMRVEAFDGRLEISSSHGNGCRLAVFVPMRNGY
jgi:signal transduction histidine kinase